MDKAIQATQAGPCVYYQRRRPEETTLYRLVQEYVDSFFTQVEREIGAGLPEFVKEEFEAFLECGILTHDFCTCVTQIAFLRILWPSPVKRHGFCSDCSTWRMAKTGTHLVDRVFPRVPIIPYLWLNLSVAQDLWGRHSNSILE